MPPQQARTSLPSLPAELIEHILLCLPQQQRGSCMLVCRRLAAVGRGSRRLWHAVHNRRPAALLAALACNPSLHIEELLWGSSPADSLFEYRWACEGEVEAATRVAASLGERLQSLNLEVRCFDVSTDWVEPLQGLRHVALHVFSSPYPEDGQSVLTLTRHLGALPALQSIWVVANKLRMDPGCIPPQLIRLSLWTDCAPNDLLLLCAAAAGSLRKLQLDGIPRWGLIKLGWDPLASLAALTK
ncbi:hypothetical protein ABPG75_004458 [Micractinium tetrahymenae]